MKFLELLWQIRDYELTVTVGMIFTFLLAVVVPFYFSRLRFRQKHKHLG